MKTRQKKRGRWPYEDREGESHTGMKRETGDDAVQGTESQRFLATSGSQEIGKEKVLS